jgi:hypothetical protein
LSIGAHGEANYLVQGVFGGGLETQISRSGEAMEVLLNIGKMRGFMNLKLPWTWGWGPANLLDWTLQLNQEIPIALEIVSANAETVLELGDLRVRELNLTSTANSIVIGLPARAGHTAVSIETSTRSLVIRVPPEVGVQIRAPQALPGARIDLSRFPMTEHPGEYRSANHEVTANRIDIDLKAVPGSVEIV